MVWMLGAMVWMLEALRTTYCATGNPFHYTKRVYTKRKPRLNFTEASELLRGVWRGSGGGLEGV
eukprot:5342542-Pyramimonas_sp.AAC.1